mgnify:CR=1 FL=1
MKPQVKESQEKIILRYLQDGKKLTPIKCLQICGSMRAAARIYDLKAKGHEIQTEMIFTARGKRVAQYSL